MKKFICGTVLAFLAISTHAQVDRSKAPLAGPAPKITLGKYESFTLKNGLKVISLYRLGDVCLILAMWMAHHVFQKNITFSELNNGAVLQEYLQQHFPMLWRMVTPIT